MPTYPPVSKRIGDIINNAKFDICDAVLLRLSTNFPKLFKEERFRTNILAVIDSLLADIHRRTSVNMYRAGLTYVYMYNGWSYYRNQDILLYSIHYLKEEIVSRIEQFPDHIELIQFRFHLVLEILTEDTIKEVKLWDYASKVLPFLALTVLVLAHLFDKHLGYDIYHSMVLTVIAVFFTAGVSWWSWVIWKIAAVYINLKRAYRNFHELKQDIGEVKKLIHKRFDHKD